jgi:hypothetical protein
VFDGLAGYDYVIYIDSGTYIFTDTVTIPSGIKIVGECWPSLMASGANFNDELNPRPLIRVGGVGASPGSMLNHIKPPPPLPIYSPIKRSLCGNPYRSMILITNL